MKNPLIKRLSRHLRGRWRARALGTHGIGVLADTKNGLLAVQVGDFNVSRALLEQGEYDWPAIQWLKRLLKPDARLIFAGAHIGSLLVPLAHACPDAAVLAFEPSPRNFRLLKLNLLLNDLPAVQVFNVALGEQSGQVGFTENRINTGNSRLARDGGEIQVVLEPLDRSVPLGWDRIDLLVMDVEGSEVAAMRGARDTLARTRYFYVEFAPEQLREQGSSAAEFIELAATQFRSAYIVGESVTFLGPDEFAAHLRGLEHLPGLLRNVLFCRDETADLRLLGTGAGSARS